MSRRAKAFYSENKYWLQWGSVVCGPLIWAVVFSWIVFGNGLPTLHEFVSERMEAKFTMWGFIRSAIILIGTIITWKFKLIPNFSPFWMKLSAGFLLSAVVGGEFAFATWNCQLNQHSDENLFAAVGFMTWVCYFGIICIINNQTPQPIPKPSNSVLVKTK